jgi:hypothetical protein
MRLLAMRPAQGGFPSAPIAALQWPEHIVPDTSISGAIVMLSCFGIYSHSSSSWFRKSATQSRKRRFFFAIQPHEIAMLNAISGVRKLAKAEEPVPVEERHAA